MIKRELGLIGLIGIAFVIFGIAYYFSAIAPAQEKLVDVQNALMVADNQQENTNEVTIKVLNPSEQLGAFLSNFPNEASINTTWENISKLQEKLGLTVERSVYEVSPQATADLLRYRLNIPLTATYPQVRDFIAELIQANTNLALDSISFKRESADNPLVNANIGLIIYVRTQ